MTGYLFAFLLVVFVVSVCLLVLGLIGLSARRQAKRKTPRRVRPERAEEIDLGAERFAFESRRDSYLEEVALRRVA